MSQVAPVKPAVQAQVKAVLLVFVHAPPFRHGLLVHGSEAVQHSLNALLTLQQYIGLIVISK
jgi:HEPN domain-containing protein